MLKHRPTQAIGLTLPLRRGNSGYFETTNEILPQVKSNFLNLIQTRLGERVAQPEFGCGIWEYLFEPLTPETIQGMQSSVVDAVDKWMPYLELLRVDITQNSDANMIDNHSVNIYVAYRIRDNLDLKDDVYVTIQPMTPTPN